MPNSLAPDTAEVSTQQRAAVDRMIERAMRPRLTAEHAIAKLRAFAASRDLIVAAPRTTASSWYELAREPQVWTGETEYETAPATLRSGGI